MQSLLSALDRRAPKYEEALECADYFRNNRHRMRIPGVSRTGYAPPPGSSKPAAKWLSAPDSSGLACTGPWVGGANAIIALRCSKLRARYEDFWERRSERPA
jgi:hypothetical protein